MNLTKFKIKNECKQFLTYYINKYIINMHNLRSEYFIYFNMTAALVAVATVNSIPW